MEYKVTFTVVDPNASEVPPAVEVDKTAGIEFRVNEGKIQWKYADPNDTSWTDIIALSELTGAAGTNGSEIELRTNSTHIQWKYKDSNEWTDLVALSEITGPQGAQGEKGETGEEGSGCNGAIGSTAIIVCAGLMFVVAAAVVVGKARRKR